MVQISLQNSGGKVVSFRGFHGTPPWAPSEVKVPCSLVNINNKTRLGKITCPLSFKIAV